MSIDLSLVVPCYNEEKNIPILFEKICNTLNKLDFEIIFVNDGSTDNTWNTLKELYLQKDIKIKIINFSRNFGKEAAIYAGLEKALGRYTVLIDADLQQSPSVVLEMYEEITQSKDIDMVAAFQMKRNEGIVLKCFKRTFYKMINKLSEIDFVNGASDFRMFNSKVRDSIISMKEYHRFSKGLFSWIGYNTKFIPYEAHERAFGKSKWSFLKLLSYAIEGIVAFSTQPLKWSAISGVICGFAAFIYMIIVFLQKIFMGIDVSGYATIVILILFIGGMQMFFLGIIGEYLSKIFIQSKHRPLYLVKEYYENE